MAAPYETPIHPFKPEIANLQEHAAPELGALLSPQEHARSVNDLAEAMNQVVTNQTDTINLALNQNKARPNVDTVYGSMMGPDGRSIADIISGQYAVRQGDLAARDAQITSDITDVLYRGDTGALLDHLASIHRISAYGRWDASDAHASASDARYGSVDPATGKPILGSREVANTTSHDLRTERLAGKPTPVKPSKLPLSAKKEDRRIYRQQLRDYHNEVKRVGELSSGDYKARIRQENDSAALAKSGRHLTHDFLMHDKISEITKGEIETYQAKLDELDVITQDVHGLNNSWILGEATPDPERPAYIATVLGEWAKQLDGLSKYDSNRIDSAENWTIQTVRLQQRRALAKDTSDSNIPEFTADRGITLDTPTGRQILYDDGSVKSNVGGVVLRRHANGETWIEEQQPTRPEASFNTNYTALTDLQVHSEYSQAMYNWERDRTPDAEIEAAIMTNEMSTRLEALSAQHTAYHIQKGMEAGQAVFDHTTASTNRNSDVTNQLTAALSGSPIQQAYNHAYTSRDSEINSQLAATGIDPADTAATKAARTGIETRVDLHVQALKDIAKREADAAKLAIEATVDANIDSLRLAAIAAEAARDAAKAGLDKAKENENGMQYWRGFMAVTRPKQASGDTTATPFAEMEPDGAIKMTDRVLNGVRGNWIINPNGTSTLCDAAFVKISDYKANGEI